MILPFIITRSTHLWNSDNPSYWNYGINTSVELRQSFLLELWDQVFTELPTTLPFGIIGSTHMWNTDNPSYWNYRIKSLRSYQRSFLLELRDLGLYGVTNDPSFRNYGINTSVELRHPSSRNYGINTCSRVPKSPDPF